MVVNLAGALALAGALVLAGSACGSDREPTRWMLQVDTLHSDLDGSLRFAATLELPGKGGVEGLPRDEDVRLKFDCRKGTGAFAAVLTERHLESGTAALRITLDSQPPYDARAATGAYGPWGMVYISEWSALLDSLRGHRSMLLHYSGAHTPGAAAEFSLAGIDSLRPHFLAACERQ